MAGERRTDDSASHGVSKLVIEEFDRYLSKKGLSFEDVAVGAAPLVMIDVIDRMTRDCDILDPDIPENIRKAAEDFAASKRSEGKHLLIDDWFNNGPRSLKELLPAGWRERTHTVFEGRSLTLHMLGRTDLLRTKLFAYCDRNTDLGDCLALKPTSEELADALHWVQQQDANPMWPDYVKERFADLEKQLGTDRRSV